MAAIVTKVFDTGCPICESMSRYDKSVMEGFPEVSFQSLSFDDIRDAGNNPTKLRLYQLLERYAVSSTYEIDFPTYMVMSPKGEYLGHLQGALTIKELREGVSSILHPSE